MKASPPPWVAMHQPTLPSARRCGMPSGAIAGGSGVLIDPNYHTPYALHASAGVEYAFTPNWTLSGDYIRETGMRAYRAYNCIQGYSLFSPLYPQDPVSQQASVPDTEARRLFLAELHTGAGISAAGDYDWRTAAQDCRSRR